MPYLIILNAKAFAGFMKVVFDAKEQLDIDRNDTLIMHGVLRINDAVIMFADANEQFKKSAAGIFIYMERVDAIYAKAMAHVNETG